MVLLGWKVPGPLGDASLCIVGIVEQTLAECRRQGQQQQKREECEEGRIRCLQEAGEVSEIKCGDVGKGVEEGEKGATSG